MLSIIIVEAPELRPRRLHVLCYSEANRLSLVEGRVSVLVNRRRLVINGPNITCPLELETCYTRIATQNMIDIKRTKNTVALGHSIARQV